MSEGGSTLDDMDGTELENVQSLQVTTEHGMWRIASASTTVYYLDLDLQAVVRARGVGSVGFLFDDEWAHLVDVICYDPLTGIPESDVIRVAGRPRYRFDPGPDWPDVEWRLQRNVISIERVEPTTAAVLRASFVPTPR